MSKLKLEKYEKEILEAYDADEFESILTTKRKKELSQTVDNTFKKDKRINIRLLSRDLSAIQRKTL